MIEYVKVTSFDWLPFDCSHTEVLLWIFFEKEKLEHLTKWMTMRKWEWLEVWSCLLLSNWLFLFTDTCYTRSTIRWVNGRKRNLRNETFLFEIKSKVADGEEVASVFSPVPPLHKKKPPGLSRWKSQMCFIFIFFWFLFSSTGYGTSVSWTTNSTTAR